MEDIIEKKKKEFREKLIESYQDFGCIEHTFYNQEDFANYVMGIINEEIEQTLKEAIETICNEMLDEKIMPRVWNLDKDTIDKYIKTFPNYEPKIGEEYQVGFVRGETWGALKIKKELIDKINQCCALQREKAKKIKTQLTNK